jgi:hypothetical protein
MLRQLSTARPLFHTITFYLFLVPRYLGVWVHGWDSRHAYVAVAAVRQLVATAKATPTASGVSASVVAERPPEAPNVALWFVVVLHLHGLNSPNRGLMTWAFTLHSFVLTNEKSQHLLGNPTSLLYLSNSTWQTSAVCIISTNSSINSGFSRISLNSRYVDELDSST